jgi:hypothetical protein
MKNEGLEFGDFHQIKADESELEDSNAKASAGKPGLALMGKTITHADGESWEFFHSGVFRVGNSIRVSKTTLIGSARHRNTKAIAILLQVT